MTNQLPAYLQNRQSKAVAQTLQANLGAGSPPYLSIESNRFTLIDAVGNALPVQTFDPQLGVYIDINIIDVNSHISKIFFDPDIPYDPKATDRLPPLCWSDNGVGPSRNAMEPQSPTCAACPNNVWGSATSKVTGKGIKACSDIQKVVFTTAGHKTVFLLRIPPNSLAEMRSYVGRFASGDMGDLTDVVTRVSFKAGIQGTLQFQAVSYIDEVTHALREAILAAKSSDAIVGRLDTPHPGLAALPAPAQEIRSVTITSQGSGWTAPPVSPGQPIGGAGQAPGGVGTYVPYNPPIPPSGGGQVAPFPAGAPSTATVSPSTIPVETATPAASPSRRRGRPPAQAAQPTAPAQAAVQAPFPTNAPAAPFPASAPPPGNNFGIQPGVPPNAEIAATLNQLFPR